MSVSGNDDDDDFSDLDFLDEDVLEQLDETEVEEYVETHEAKPERPAPRPKKHRESLPLIDVEPTPDSEAIRRPLISGHCNFPGEDKAASHKRCQVWTRANPDKIFQPCPCSCHFPEERYECESCGGVLVEAEHYPLDEDGDVRYVHFDPSTRRITTCSCPS